MLRGENAFVIVPAKSSCLSSCVLILAAGTSRFMQGAIGIHRPYFETPKSAPTNADVSAQMALMRNKIITYLTNMNVNGTLADDMMKIPPERVRYLSGAELNHYGLLERDPVDQEAQDLREAVKYGLSRAEYIKRAARAKIVCAAGRGIIDVECEVDILTGKR